MVNNTDNEYEIDLRELFMVLLRRWWAIALAIVFGGAAAFGYTYFLVDPLYQASTLLYVNNSDISVGATSFSISNADLTAAQKLVDTYATLDRQSVQGANIEHAKREIEDSLDTVRKSEFARVHAFRYSPRKGTKSAELKDTVSGSVSSDRAERLEAAAKETAKICLCLYFVFK